MTWISYLDHATDIVDRYTPPTDERLYYHAASDCCDHVSLMEPENLWSDADAIDAAMEWMR